jgi:Domain of unknown function (DUF4440)
MKNIFLLSFLVSISFLGNSQNKQETRLKAAIQSLKTAMIEGNKVELEKFTSDKLSYGHSGGKVETKAELINSLITNESDFVTMNFSNESIQISKNVAIVRQRLDAETNNRGIAAVVKLDVLQVWQYEKGQWKLLARQAIKVAV